MALAVTRESLPSWATALAYLCRGHRCLLSTSHLAASLSPSGSQPQTCVCSAWPHIAQIRHPTAWLGGPAHCRCSAPPGRVGRKAHSVNATRLGSCVCAALRSPRVLWARTGLGGPESQMSSEWWPTQWSRGPSFSCPTGHTAADAVSAPGPQVADGLPGHRRCGSQCQRASQHAHNWKTNILFLRCTFRPAHTQDGTCETTLLSAWREENSLPNKSQGTFPKHTGIWQGPRANALPGHTLCQGGFYGSRTGDMEGGCEGPRGDSYLELGAPKATAGYREAGLRSTGVPPGPPRSRYWLPERGDSFWKNEQVFFFHKNLILQMSRLSPREGRHLSRTAQPIHVQTDLLTSGLWLGEHSILGAGWWPRKGWTSLGWTPSSRGTSAGPWQVITLLSLSFSSVP